MTVTASAAADRARAWLAGAMAALAVLAAAAAVVSWDAQYALVLAIKSVPAIAALEAGIPDVGAVIFAALGIALALHGRRAIRPRSLNVGCVGISLAMNALAAAPGWRDLAVWVMPAAVYALASDTLIGVVRAWAIARTRHTGQSLADDDATPMAIVGGLILWLLRLTLAPPSTLRRVPPLGAGGMPRRPGPQGPACRDYRQAVSSPLRTPASPGGDHPPGRHEAEAGQAGPDAGPRRAAARPGRPSAQAGIGHRQPDRRRGQPLPRHRPPRPARPRPRPPERPPSRRKPREIPHPHRRRQPVTRLPEVGVPALDPLPAAAPPPGPPPAAARPAAAAPRPRPRHPRPSCGCAGARLAAFRRSGRARPSLAWRERVIGPASAYSHPHRPRAPAPRRCGCPLEEHAVVTSPPRGGKTGWLASVILRYPGPGAVDHDQARRVRADLRRPRPARPASTCSTRRASETCPAPSGGTRSTAARTRPPRSAALTPSPSRSPSTASRTPASGPARPATTCAPTSSPPPAQGLDLRHVARWVTGAGALKPRTILARIPGPGRQWARPARRAARRGQQDRADHPHDHEPRPGVPRRPGPGRLRPARPRPVPRPGRFVRQAGTLYLIAESRGEDSPVAPLFACLANELHYAAALAGSRMPGGRLDPPLLMALDEVTQICPVPVPSWLADSGGKGIQIITVAHGEAQLRARWGRDGARIILDTSGAKIWLPGISDPDTLKPRPCSAAPPP